MFVKQEMKAAEVGKHTNSKLAKERRVPCSDQRQDANIFSVRGKSIPIIRYFELVHIQETVCVRDAWPCSSAQTLRKRPRWKTRLRLQPDRNRSFPVIPVRLHLVAVPLHMALAASTALA